MLNMNYLHTYIKLVKRYKERKMSKGYTENHHYLPVSIFGQNNRTIVVTFREHFVLHRLLAKVCEKRYGLNHPYTRKMNMAIHRMVYGSKNQDRLIRTSREFEIARKAVLDAKIGKPRPDMVGKTYFGASEETIKAMREKYKKTRTGKHINYPKTRRPLSNRTPEVFAKIAASRKLTYLKYQNMSEEEFLEWLNKQNVVTITKTGKQRVNANVTRALKVRGKSLKDYYKEENFPEGWLQKYRNKKLFYGL